ncbi:uncharacterized protein LOC128200612 [Galleria mellonella]|uniref:Uncharacterized protein LOC128200612 n=1 Tax=Galleria mellonella TaxID=7137 RepID=A0ABM3MHB5_GALME|nr:uncharacterized protein LOC128200612 [Galleria mellonella]
MVVETRSVKKANAASMEQGQFSTVQHGSPTSSTPTAGAQQSVGIPSGAASSVSGSSTTVRSRTLQIEADYAKKIAMLERAALERAKERERVVLEQERAALVLQKQARIAALEERGSIRTRSSRSSHISNREVRKWLDTCLEAIPSVEVNEQPQNIKINTSCSKPTTNSNCSAALAAHLQIPNNSFNPVTTTDTQYLRPILKESNVANNFDVCTSPARASSSATKIKPVSSTINKTPSDIALLAEAITSLSKESQHNVKFGDGRLPFFDGKPLDWLTFKRVYDNTKSRYSDSDNLTRINMALRGEAHDAVAVLLVSAQDPTQVIQALATRFGRPELIVLQEVAMMRSLPKVNIDCSDLHKFACRVRNSVEVMKLLEQRCYLESPELFQSILSKLTPLLRTRWADFAASHFHQEVTKLELLASFLTQEVDLQLKFGLLNEPIYYNRSNKIRSVAINKPSTSIVPYIFQSETHEQSSSVTSHNKKICYFCNDDHSLSHCNNFKILSVDDRWKFVNEKKLCHKCLRKGSHNYKSCNISKEICNNKKCNSRHHKLLHIAHVVESEVEHGESSSTPQSGELEGSDESSCKQTTDFIAHASNSLPLCNVQHPCYRPFLKIIAVEISGPRGSVNTYALLDDGSTATFIDSELAAKIGARGPTVKTLLKCVGGLSKHTEIEYVDFNIRGCHVDKTYQVKQARSIKDLQLAKQSVCPQDISKFSYLSDLASYLCYENAQPKIVIGIDNWHLTIPQSIRKGTRTQPAAINTALGWVLFGFSSSKTSPVDLVNHVQCNETDFNKTDLLENLIKNYYKLDSIGITKKEPRSADDERAIEILERTANRLPCGRFEVGLLWKSNNPVIPNSYPLALSRFLSLEKKMISDPTYAERYKQNIRDLVTKDYAEKCQNEPSSNSVCWFLPHFGIINPNKPAKLRVVHDAAAKIKGVSLNSLLLTGPDLLQSLIDILLRFREGKVAMTADIKEMFPRFKIIEQDRDAQRFLWRDSPTDPIETYRMSSMIFGAVSSPFTAMYMKNKNALEFKDQYPDAVHGIIYDTYMDDYIGSVDSSSDEAAQLAADIVNIHARAGLEMRGWVSNDPKALRLLPNHLLSESVSNINLNLANFPSSTPCIRALGLYWHPSSDLIGFNTSIKSNQETLPSSLTKRIILSLIMRVFDPLGILAPVVIRGRISKRLALKPNQIELHVFADASAQAYAAVAYWRFVYPNGDVQLALICSKSRVAPLKPSSIPRLELQAALIAARLATTIVEAVKFKPLKRTFLCDSMNVLGWLRNDARSYKTFVAHRVGEIIELSDVSEWHWVPTAYNVADDSTRLSRGPLTSDSRWIKGPEFLLTSDWPKEPAISHNQTIHTNTPETHIHLINEIESNKPISADAQRFSSWNRLIRATAYAHRYLSLLRLTSLRKKGLNIELIHKVEGRIFSFRPPSNSNVDRQRNTIRSTLTAEDLHLAEIHVLRKSQLDSFSYSKRFTRVTP